MNRSRNSKLLRFFIFVVINAVVFVGALHFVWSPPRVWIPPVSGWTRGDWLASVGDTLAVIGIEVAIVIGLPMVLQMTPGKPNRIKTYYCCPRNGVPNKQRGELFQGLGCIVPAALAKNLGVKHLNGLWKWTPNPGQWCPGGAVIWGPYSFDCTQKGTYEARFKIKGEGFKASSDRPCEALVELDVSGVRYAQVTSLQRDYSCTPKVLSNPDWNTINLEFAIDSGQEELEYRVHLFDGHSDYYTDRLGSYHDVSILFDRVEIWRKRSVWDMFCDFFNPNTE